MVNDIGTLDQIRQLWQIVRNRKWVIFLAAVMLSATAVVLIGLLPDWYSSSITILVDPQKISDRYVSDSVTLDQLRMDTLSQQVLSLTRLERIIDDLQLYPELRSCMSREDVVDYMRKYITIQMRPGGDRNPGVFTITYKGKDAKLVAPVVSQLASSFIEWDLAARERQVTHTADFVSNELHEAKSELERQQGMLKDYKLQHIDALPDQLPGKLSRLQTELQANIDTLNRLDAERTLLTQAPPPAKSAALDDRAQLEEQQAKLETQLTDLRSRYSSEYPDVLQVQDRLALVKQRLARTPVSTEPASNTPSGARLTVVNREIARLQGEQKELSAQVATYQTKADEIPIREQQLAQLNTDYQDAKAHYQTLLDRNFSAGMAADLQQSRQDERFSVLEPARVPEHPIKPHRRVLLACMIPFCFLFSAGLVVILETAKGKVTTERELRLLLPSSVMIIGRIPVISTPVNRRRELAWASVAITGSLLCGIAVTLFLRAFHPYF